MTTDMLSPKPRPIQNGTPRKFCSFWSAVNRSVRITRTDSGDRIRTPSTVPSPSSIRANVR